MNITGDFVRRKHFLILIFKVISWKMKNFISNIVVEWRIRLSTYIPSRKKRMNTMGWWNGSNFFWFHSGEVDEDDEKNLNWKMEKFSSHGREYLHWKLSSFIFEIIIITSEKIICKINFHTLHGRRRHCVMEFDVRSWNSVRLVCRIFPPSNFHHNHHYRRRVWVLIFKTIHIVAQIVIRHEERHERRYLM